MGWRKRLWPAMLGGTFFGVFGPLVGLGTWALIATVVTLNPLAAVMFIAQWQEAIRAGLIPALILGIIAGVLKPTNETLRGLILLAITGSLLAIAWNLVADAYGIMRPSMAMSWEHAAAVAKVIGIPALLASSLVLTWFRHVREPW